MVGSRWALICALGISLVGCGTTQLPFETAAAKQKRVFAHDATSSYQVIYNFQGGMDGIFPADTAAPLTVWNDELYGTTETGGGAGGYCELIKGCGIVFKVDPSGGESVIYAFQSKDDGDVPTGNVIRFGGAWYGTTNEGGANGYGTLFKINAAWRKHLIHSFNGSGDGANPYGQLLVFQHVLYGTTSAGGSAGKGTVFKFTPSGGVQVLHTFTGNPDGAAPIVGLIELHGILYGTTTEGGAGAGTIYSITTSGVENVIHSFTVTDGANPHAPLTAIGHEFYGTAWRGGGRGYLGTAFKVSLTGKVHVLHRFSEYGGADGYNPESTLFDFNGMLYGTTSEGGTWGDGVAFSLTESGTENILHDFGLPMPDGLFPTGGVTAIGNTLYGTTSAGGTGKCYYPTGCGTIFALTP